MIHESESLDLRVVSVVNAEFVTYSSCIDFQQETRLCGTFNTQRHRKMFYLLTYLFKFKLH